MFKMKLKKKSGLKKSLLKFQKLLSVLFILTPALMMMGCTTSTSLDIPANLKVPCADLRKVESGTGKDIYPVMIDDRSKYGECARRHVAIVKIIDKSSK